MSAILTAVPGSLYAPAGGPPALISHTAHAANDSDNCTTSAIDTRGANLIVVGIAWYFGVTSSGTLTDSKGNTWSPLTAQSINPGGGDLKEQMFYCFNPVVDAAHTFHYAGSITFPAIAVQAWSNMASSTLDQQNGAGAFPATTLNTGSITPSQANTVLVSFLGYDSPSTFTGIDSGFTITDEIANGAGVTEGNAMAYKVLTSSSATNPQWTQFDGANDMAATVASFKY